MYDEKQTAILIALGNIIEAKEDATRNGIYAQQNNDGYEEQYIKMRDEAYKTLQINLLRIADAIGLPRNQMPGVYPEYFDYQIEN